MAEESQDKQNIQASGNSVATGDIKVEGSIDGSMIIGNYNQIFTTAPGEDLSVKILNRKKDYEPETILISEGNVWMGLEDEEKTPEDEKQHYKLHLPLYRISKFPITYAQFKKFTQEDKNSDDPKVNWDGLKLPDGPDDGPVTGVTLDHAKAYCEWLSDETERNYTIPNEAQLEKAYQEPNGCADIVDNLLQWTCTLWGAKAITPDSKFRYPSTDSEQNDLNANSQIRRVVCNYPKQDNAALTRVRQRSGKFPWDAGFPGERHGFRVVMEVPQDRKVE